MGGGGTGKISWSQSMKTSCLLSSCIGSQGHLGKNLLPQSRLAKHNFCAFVEYYFCTSFPLVYYK